MALTIHVDVDNASNEQLDRAVLYLLRTNQRLINIAGGSQIDRAMYFAERVRTALPNIDIIWRQLEDTGILSKMTVDAWWASRIAPRLDWLKKNRAIVLIDNETSGDDNIINQYVSKEKDALTRLHTVGLNGAVCRFATGNIGDGSHGTDQYKLLKPLFDILQPGDHVSPNEYSNSPGKSSGGHLNRWSNLERVAGKQLNISIGEAGIAADYNSGAGWQTVTTPEKFVAQMLSEEVWYRNGDIDRALFVVGGYSWPTFQMTEPVYTLLEAYYALHPIKPKGVVTPPVPTPPPVVPPTPPVTNDLTIIRVTLKIVADALQTIVGQMQSLINILRGL